MNIQELFVTASRKKFRFETRVGLLSVEDLWELPLTSKTKVSLDEVAVALRNKLKDSQESFVEASTKDAELEQKFEIAKYVIEVRMNENRARLEERDRAEKRAQLSELIAKKENEALETLSIEELKAMAAKL